MHEKDITFSSVKSITVLAYSSLNIQQENFTEKTILVLLQQFLSIKTNYYNYIIIERNFLVKLDTAILTQSYIQLLFIVTTSVHIHNYYQLCLNTKST
jgi:hypothetical protein